MAPEGEDWKTVTIPAATTKAAASLPAAGDHTTAHAEGVGSRYSRCRRCIYIYLYLVLLCYLNFYSLCWRESVPMRTPYCLLRYPNTIPR